MKKWWFVVLVALLLCGCGKAKDLETVSDVCDAPALSEPQEVYFTLPEGAAKEAMTSENSGSVYFCGDYFVTAHTVPAGDLQNTILETSGFLPEQLPVMKTLRGGCQCYDFVWTAAGEQGDQVGRCAILDDGNYHYVLTAMADAEDAGRLSRGAWEEMFSSYCIALPEEQVNIGS